MGVSAKNLITGGVMGELKYPVKYAIMPVLGQVGWTVGLHQMERQYDVVAYIVSKAYITSETIKYYSDGSRKILYNVVFPYNDNNLDTKILPKYNINGDCTNSVEVSNVFDTYEEALQSRDLENRKLRSLCCFVSKSKQFTEVLKQCFKLEEFILCNTNGMIISQEKQKTYTKI